MCVFCSFRSACIPFDRLSLERREIYRMMGSGSYEPDDEMKNMVEQTIGHISAFCKPRYGYAIYSSQGITEDTVTIGGKTFYTGSVITENLRDADRFALMVATSGAEFERWYRGEVDSGDILREFVASNIGSEIAEAAGRVAEEDIAGWCGKSGWGTGRSYAPGYCGWDISGQHGLFALLPPLPCGIMLNSSCLMTPIKSISGIIPVGANVTKKAYGCAICNQPGCYKKR